MLHRTNHKVERAALWLAALQQVHQPVLADADVEQVDIDDQQLTSNANFSLSQARVYEATFASSEYKSCKPDSANRWTLEIVKRSDATLGFEVLPRRWVVEVVFTQMAKPNVLAVGAGGQHVADLDLGIGDDDAVDQQQHELTALLEAGLGQSALNALAKRFQRGRHAGKLLLASGIAA